MAGKKSPSIFSTLQKTTENASAVNGELTRQLPVASLVDNPMNRFSMAEDDEFLSTMRSVEQDGFLEDIVVTPDGENTWRIISGHRRVMAARKLGKTAVPCKVRRYPDKLSELRALMGANVHRRSLSPFDMARQLETLREVLSESGQLPEGTKEQAGLMAAQSDLSRATVERHLDLLNLDETMTGWAERGEMTMTDTYEMAAGRTSTSKPPWRNTSLTTTPTGTSLALSTGPSPGRKPPSCPRLRPSPPRPPILCGRWIPLVGPSGVPPLS